jgi:hypothetical protein
MRFRLRTLMIVMAMGPPLIAVAIWLMAHPASRAFIWGPLYFVGEGPILDRTVGCFIAALLLAGISIIAFRRSVVTLAISFTSVVIWLWFGLLVFNSNA